MPLLSVKKYSLFLYLSIGLLLLSCGKDSKIMFKVDVPQSVFISDVVIPISNQNEDENGEYEESNEDENSDESPNVNGYSVQVGIDTNLENLKYPITPLQINCSVDGTSVANLEYLDGSIPNGVTILPEIAGQWRFKDENTLTFMPNGNWAPGTEYTVTMNPEIFQKGLVNSKQVVKFKTPPFASKVVNSGLVREAGEERTPRFVVAVEFTHAVDTASFEKAIRFKFDNGDAKFTVKYDDALRKAIITSEPVAIINESRKFVFTAENFVTKDTKSNVTTQLRATETVPDYGSIFYLKGTQYTIVKDKQNTPHQILFFEFTDSIDPKKIDESIELYIIPRDKANNELDYHVKNKANYKKLKVQQAESEGLPDTIYSLYTDVSRYEDRLLVIMNNSFVSKSGFPLKNKFQKVMSFPSYPKELNIINDGSILPLGGDKILTFASRGISDINVQIGKLVDYERLYSLITGSYYGGIKEMSFKGSLDKYDYVDKIRDEKFNIRNKSPKEVSYSAVNLSRYLENGESGVFFITANDMSSGYSNEMTSRIIIVTDMGILSKKNEKGESSVFVVSLTNHTPVDDAKVEILGRNGVPVFKCQTSVDGRCDYPDLSKLNKEKRPVAIVVTKGKDISFLPLDIYGREVSLSRFDVGGISDIYNPIRAFAFTDRGIYRPGEKVSIGTIVKQSNWAMLEGATVVAEIYSPMRDKPILKREFSLDKYGFFEFNYQTSTTMQTGYYAIEIYRRDNDNRRTFLGESRFKLEEFEPETMKVNVAIKGKVVNGWQKVDNVSGYIKVENLFGSSAVDRRVKWEAEVLPVTFRFKGFADYKFTNPTIRNNSNNIQVFTPTIKDSKTDANGEARANIDITSLGAGTFQLTLVGESFEPESGDSVKGYDTAYLSTLDYLVGYKTNANLNFIKRNAKKSIEFVALDNNLNKINLKDLKYQLKNINYVMSLVKTTYGTYTYQAVEKATIVNEGSYAISNQGVTYDIPTKDAGKYLLEIYSKDNKLISSVQFFVSGSTNLETGIEKSAELSIQLDKEEYKNGEEIELNIIAPYVGAGLIAIERDKIYAYKWFKTNTSSTVQRIKLPDGIEGNAYINVSFIRDPQSKDIFITPYSYGVVPFKINTDNRKININLKTDDIVFPGDNLKIKYKADKDASLILYGVDEGILQVSGYRLPDPLAFFMTKRALTVNTTQTVDLVIPNYKIIKDMLASGGGESMINKRLNPFARKTLTPAVFWSSIKKVEAGKEYEYSYTVPEHFNGTIKILAVAVNSNAIGAVESSVLSRSPIVMIVNNPLTATTGDRFKATVSVNNFIENSGKEDIKITAKSSKNIDIIGESSKSVTVDYKGEKTVSFDVKIKDGVVGASEIVFFAENSKVSKPIRALGTLSVRPSSTFKTSIMLGSSTSNTFDINSGFRDMFDEYATRYLGVSTNPLIMVIGMSDSIAEYPHGCSEQIVSKIIPQMLLSLVLDSAEFKATTLEKHKATIQELRKRSKGSDGYTLWANSNSINDEVSVYIAHYLTDAHVLNFPVPSDMMAETMKYLGNFSMKEPKNLDDARLKAYASYLIARNGVSVSRQLNALEEYLNAKYKNEWKSDIVAAYIGATYATMKAESKGLQLMNGFKPNTTKYLNYSDYDNDAIRNAMYLYLTTIHDTNNLDKLNELRMNIVKNLAEAKNLNTITTAKSVMALGIYSYDNVQKIIPSITATVGGKETALKQKSYSSSVIFPANVSKFLVKYPDSSKTTFFYYMLQSGYDKAIPAVASNGIEVVKEYYDSKGVKTNIFKLGDVMTVKIMVRLTDKNIEAVNNLAITDILPGGVEVIRGGGMLGSNFDIREDRVLIYSNLYNSSKVTEFTYNAKAVSVGEFITPPIYAEDMYRLSVNGNSGVGKLIIKDAE